MTAEEKRDKTRLLASLSTKIILGTSLVLVIILGAFMYVDVISREATLVEHEENHAFDISNTLMKSIEYPMLDGSMDEVGAILQRVMELKELRVAHLCDPSGLIVYSGIPDSTGKASKSKAINNALRTNTVVRGMEIFDGEKILGHAMPIPNEKPCFKCHGSEQKILGALLVGTAWEPVEKNIKAILNRHIVYFIACLALLIGLIAVLLHYLVITPVGSLTSATMVIAKEGDLSYRVPIKRNDEIGHLGIAFNQMAENLEKSRDDLLRAQAGLEKLVVQLEQRGKELEDFTYIVSHDLKEPLRGITSFTQFVLEDYGNKLDEKGKGFLATIANSAQRLKKLIEDLLMLSRVARTEVLFRAINASKIIDEAIEWVKYSMDEKGVELAVAQRLPTIHCDKSRMAHVFANLLSNAIKFMDKDNPRIEIGYQSTEDYHQFYVKDNGMGIDKQYHEKIFGMFQRLQRREDYEGTGAGLHIAKKIVERHRGNIWVQSELGEGSTFYFRLPKIEQTQGVET